MEDHIEYDGFGTIYHRNAVGDLHRDNGPAIECESGFKEYLINGIHHRLDGPAVEDVDGNKIFIQNGEYHRLDGPAIESNLGTNCWYLYGHKIDVSSQKEFEQYLRLLAFI